MEASIYYGRIRKVKLSNYETWVGPIYSGKFDDAEDKRNLSSQLSPTTKEDIGGGKGV